MKSEHIEEDRLSQFAIEAIDDLTDAENIHLDDCVKCRRRLVVAFSSLFLRKRLRRGNSSDHVGCFSAALSRAQDAKEVYGYLEAPY